MRYILPCFIMLYFTASRTIHAQVIDGAGNYSSAVCSDGTAWCWGNNTDGNLGDGTTTQSLSAVSVITLTGVTAVANGGGFQGAPQGHTLFLKSNGTVWGCGSNGFGEIGDGTTTSPQITPVQVTGLTGVTAVATGDSHTLFLKSDGLAWSVGWNVFGQLGDGTNTNQISAVQVINLTGVTAVAANANTSLFIKNDGTAWGCGMNFSGQIGDGTSSSQSTPVQVSGLTGITACATSGNHSLFLKNDGTVWACGSNSGGQFGDGTTTSSLTPVQVSGITGITAVAAGSSHSVFLKNNGTAWSAGYNGFGTLGDGTTTDSYTPVQVSGLTGITSVAAGKFHSLFTKTGGTVWACGQNSNGQIGDGTTTSALTPVQTTGITCNVTTLPIELLSFNVALHNIESALCTWVTSMEINNEYFTLEKSDDAVNFIPFANVSGAGNSNTPRHYQYFDTDPYSGLSYYRLKQTDFDGAFTYSGIRSLYFGDIKIVTAYPNPAGEYILYEIVSEKAAAITVKLYDMLGREVLSAEETIDKGKNIKKLNTAHLLSGNYLLTITTGSDQKIKKQFIIR